MIAVILYGFGFVGLFAIYQSTKSAYNPRQAYMMLVIGVTFLFISYIFLESAIAYKASGGRLTPAFLLFFFTTGFFFSFILYAKKFVNK